MKIAAASIQMASESGRVAANLDRAESLLRRARDQGVELAVLPEMFNTGYGLIADYAPTAEDRDGPTLRLLRDRARAWGMSIAFGYVERDGHDLYDSLGFCQPDGQFDVYRKRHLVFWERFRFRPGRNPVVAHSPWGRIGFAICADMIYRRTWADYRDRIDLAVVSAAWPDFACRHSGRQHWLFGQLGPLSGAIPARVGAELGIPVVFSNQVGETETRIPILRGRIADRFAGRSSLADGHHGLVAEAGAGEDVVLGSLTIHPAKGPRTWHSMSPSARAASSSASEPA